MDDKFFDIEKKANELRRQTLVMCIRAGTGHVTSCMSCADIMAALYPGGILRHDPQNPEWKDRDRFVLSKGQASPILYVTLADRGFFPQDWLQKFAWGDDGKGRGAPFGVHLQCDIPGVEFTTGSLGHGLGYGVGMAEAAKLDGKAHKVFVVLGDAELYEGSNWESALYAGHHKLGNLIVIVDRNGMGVDGFTENIVALEPLDDRWASYGWDVQRINGHSGESLYNSLLKAKESSSGKPSVIIADTVKGKGIKSMEKKLFVHGIAPSGEAADLARRELEAFSAEHTKNREYNDN